MGRLVVVVSGVVKREVTSNHQAACQDAKAFGGSSWFFSKLFEAPQFQLAWPCFARPLPMA